MLMALNVPINFKLYVHGWILMKEGKMSKSVGNIVYPMDVVNEYGLDSLRYYLVKEMPLGNDGLFSWDRFIERYNVELANDLGNLVSRSISMINKYFDSQVVKPSKQYFEVEADFENIIANAIEKACKNFDNFEFQNGLNELWTIVRRANKYIDETAPWVLAKDETKKEELNSVMYHLYEAIRVVAVLVQAVMPDASKVILEELGVTEENQKFENVKYGVTEKATVTKTPIVLFKRLDVQKELEKHEK
jgi:methionyl-tRNA synthetase